MKFKLFARVRLTTDLPKYGLKKGDIGTIVEYYPMSAAEDGYSLKGLLARDTLEVSESQIELVLGSITVEAEKF